MLRVVSLERFKSRHSKNKKLKRARIHSFIHSFNTNTVLYSSATVYTVYRLITFSGGTFLRGVQGNPNYFPILVQGDAVHGIGTN